MIRALLLALSMVAVAGSAAAQDAVVRPTFKPHRSDEDWRALCDPKLHVAPLDALKCISLADDASLTLGGEWRERLEIVNAPGFGLRQDEDSVLLHRLPATR